MSFAFVATPCNTLNKNWFSGNDCKLLIPEEWLDKEPIEEEDINRFIVDAKVLLYCHECTRLLIVDDKTSEIDFYVRVEEAKA